MKSISNPILLTAGLAACWLLGTGAQDIQAQSHLSVSQVLPGGTTCEHVIALMHRHGVNNSVDRAVGNSMLHHSPHFGSLAIPAAELGDLEVLQVNQILHQDDACGPRIAVIVRNNSVRSVCNFHVSAVALLGRICPTSPSVTVRVAEIKCGESLEVMLALPLEALAMGNRNGRVVGFQRLVVAIDSFDELVETNEANNIKALGRSELTIISSVVETTSGVETDVVEETAIPQSDAPGASVVPPASTSDLADPLQSAIRMLDVKTDPAGVSASGSS